MISFSIGVTFVCGTLRLVKLSIKLHMIFILTYENHNMIKDDFSPFQVWSLFNMYQHHTKYYTSRDLLITCCDSALAEINENEIDAELGVLTKDHEFIKRKYTHPSLIDLEPDNDDQFQISNRGIVWVRKNISKIEDACKMNKIKQNIIDQQEQELQTDLNEKGLSLKETILKCGIKNIAPIISLLDSLV